MLPLRWTESPTGRSDPSADRPEAAGPEAVPPEAVPPEAAGPEAVPPEAVPPEAAGPEAVPPEVGTETCVEPRHDQPSPSSPDGAQPEIVVRTSSRRRKTAAAFWENGRIVVVMPADVPRSDRPKLVEWLVGRVLAKRPGARATDDALAARAAGLADRYVDGVRPASIRWVTNQGKRWGSCSAHTGEIRLSHRLRVVPEWVLDATIVHELAHLLHPNHSAAFHAVADRYPRQRDALLFLEGYSLGIHTAVASGT
jgi:hypothetical protein